MTKAIDTGVAYHKFIEHANKWSNEVRIALILAIYQMMDHNEREQLLDALKEFEGAEILANMDTEGPVQ